MPGHPDYDVSDKGRVRSWKNGKWGKRESPVHLLMPPGNHGYPRVNLDGTAVLVHQIVLEAHVGPRPNGCEAAHENGNKHDNRLSNLRWATPGENGADNARLGVIKGERHGMHKLTTADVREIRSSGEPGRDLAKRFGVTVGTINGIRAWRSWRHVA